MSLVMRFTAERLTRRSTGDLRATVSSLELLG
jgi:hypothetical protein